MLVISNKAVATIRRLLARPGVPDGCGLRIQKAADPRRLRILLVSAPTAGDFIHDAEGARLYVAEEAAGRVQDQTLDATRSEAGRVQFVLDHVPAPRMRRDITQLDLSSDDALLSA
uniref:adhesin n=1 Tax=Paractinoplanes polyasparticus TaxID=2856853 RepID=UPI001C8522A4|nr:adhesin [Actinoplanes polyasparticus]